MFIWHRILITRSLWQFRHSITLFLHNSKISIWNVCQCQKSAAVIKDTVRNLDLRGMKMTFAVFIRELPQYNDHLGISTFSSRSNIVCACAYCMLLICQYLFDDAVWLIYSVTYRTPRRSLWPGNRMPRYEMTSCCSCVIRQLNAVKCSTVVYPPASSRWPAYLDLNQMFLLLIACISLIFSRIC